MLIACLRSSKLSEVCKRAAELDAVAIFSSHRGQFFN